MAKAKSRHHESPLPAGVPADARFVNVTELTDDVLTRTAELTVSKVLRNAYVVIGVIVGLSALVYRIVFGGTTLITILLLCTGMLLVYLSTRLVKDSVQRDKQALAKVDKGTLSRTIYSDGSTIDVILANGKVRRYPLDSFLKLTGDDKILLLILRDSSSAFALDRDGFIRGSAKGFEELMARVVPDEASKA